MEEKRKREMEEKRRKFSIPIKDMSVANYNLWFYANVSSENEQPAAKRPRQEPTRVVIRNILPAQSVPENQNTQSGFTLKK